MPNIFWFRQNLRLRDHPALTAAAETGDTYYVYIFDPDYLDQVGPNRLKFLLDALQDLEETLQQKKVTLNYFSGRSLPVLTRLKRQYQIEQIFVEADPDTFYRTLDAQIEGLQSFPPNLLFPPEDVISVNNKVPLTFTAWVSASKRLTMLPGVKTPTFSKNLKKIGTSIPTALIKKAEEATIDVIGGETEGQKRLTTVLKQTDYIHQFSKPKTNPASLVPSTTFLSPYIKFGCLSVRDLARRLAKIGSSKAVPIQSTLLGQLRWRDFFATVNVGTPNFIREKGNPICKQIKWNRNPKFLEAWTNGLTGFPWIDALMRQLRLTGWLHHLGRHSVACFLTRGDLWQSWEEGAAVFNYLLLDADESSNVGNWLWLSASAFFTAYYRVYSPVAFAKKYDKTGEFIRHYVPELAQMPLKFLFQPELAPLEIQEKAGCIIGEDYPKPIVNHREAVKINLVKMRQAYKKEK